MLQELTDTITSTRKEDWNVFGQMSVRVLMYFRTKIAALNGESKLFLVELTGLH